MKCPFLKETTSISYPEGSIQTTEFFRDCYGKECPFYDETTRKCKRSDNNAE